MGGTFNTLRTRSASELQQRLEAERSGAAFLIYRDATDAQQIHPLPTESDVVTVGRQPASDLRLDWDAEVSRVHASLQRVGAEWTLVDDGRSRNGTQLNGRRAHGRQRLSHGDVIEVGRTAIVYLDPRDQGSDSTVANTPRPGPMLSDAQQRVLTALCRPYASDAFAVPPSNRAIADELVIGVETVKTHMRDLFRLFGIQDLPQNQKRAELARQALASQVVVLPPV